jgi:hypothetical protein
MTATQARTAQTMSAKNAEAVRAGKDIFPSKMIFKRQILSFSEQPHSGENSQSQT